MFSDSDSIILFEADVKRKHFIEEEAKQVVDGSLDVTEFFENKEESTKRLLDTLKGRPIYPSKKEREEFLQRGKKLREEIKAFRIKHNIEDPP